MPEHVVRWGLPVRLAPQGLQDLWVRAARRVLLAQQVPQARLVLRDLREKWDLRDLPAPPVFRGRRVLRACKAFKAWTAQRALQAQQDRPVLRDQKEIRR